MRQLLVTILLLTSSSAFAQKGIVSECTGRQLYTCVSTRLSVDAEKAKPGSIELATDNGTIEPIKGEPGEYWINPDREGKVGVYIRQWYTKQVARNDSVNFWAVEIPLICTVAGKQGGDVAKTTICLNGSPVVRGLGPQINHRHVPVKKFDLSIIRSGNQIYKRSFAGAEIDTSAQEFLLSLQNGDRLTYTNIAVERCNKEFSLSPVELGIVDAEKLLLPASDTVVIENPETGQIEILTRHRKK